MWLSILLAVLLAFALGMLWRNELVFKLRGELLHEEHAWLVEHLDEIQSGKRKQGFFERYDHLPSYPAMLYQFWKSMKRFKQEAGTVEHYYPIKK